MIASVPPRRKSAARAKARVQCAALPFRIGEVLEVLLVTSRGTGRWVIPKGWPMKARTLWDSAALEALEEAGVEGRVDVAPLGRFDYDKILRSGDRQVCTVAVFALEVVVQRESWREQGQRTTRWFAWEDAAQAVREPGLARIIREFARSRSVAAPLVEAVDAL